MDAHNEILENALRGNVLVSTCSKDASPCLLSVGPMNRWKAG